MTDCGFSYRAISDHPGEQMIVHASNEAFTVLAIRTLCELGFANRTNAWHYAMSRLDNILLHHDDEPGQ